jgi:hypothetical protein
MRASTQKGFARWAGMLCLGVFSLAAMAGIVCGGERKGRPKLGDYNPAHDSVEMFSAIEAGLIEVKFIPRDSTKARILITNMTIQPLNVRLPETFVGVPVLAQFDPFGGNQQGGGQNGGGNQSVGGGNDRGNQNPFGNNNFFNVPAEKVGQLRVDCVCLEYGKVDPRAAIPYEIRPLSSFSADPTLHELMKLLAAGEQGQHVVQAAAWHLANGISWKDLARKRTSGLNGVGQPYFSRRQIEAAQELVALAQERAAASPTLAASTSGPTPSE